MPPGIGYNFAPGNDIQMGGKGRSGGPSFGPQEAIRMLSLRLPKSAGPSAIAPSALLNAPGGAGAPNLNSILMALVQAFAPQHQAGVPSLPSLSPPSPMSQRPSSPTQRRSSGFTSPGAPVGQGARPSLSRPSPSVPVPRIIPGSPTPQAPRQFDNVPDLPVPRDTTREELPSATPAGPSFGGFTETVTPYNQMFADRRYLPGGEFYVPPSFEGFDPLF